MPTLITGGTGVIGSELARLLVDAGEEVVIFSRTMNTQRIKDILNKVKCVKGDLGINAHVFNVVKENKISDIYHLGAMLTVASESDHNASFQTNVLGTINVMEAARMFGVRRMVFTSSIGTYGLEIGKTVTDTTIQRPTAFYGIGKLYCEGLGRYYRNKYGIEFRSIRYAAVVGPGVKTPGHWIPPMIEDAVLGKRHDSAVTKNTASWIISTKDAAKAAHMIMNAPEKNIEMVNYNVSGCVYAAGAEEIAVAVKKYIPEADINFKQDPNNLYASFGHSGDMDDSYARKEWAWKPDHGTVGLIVEAFINEMKSNPERYGF